MSFANLDIVAALAGSGLPAVLVANKCEEPDDEWEVDADGLAGHTLFDQCTAKFKVSAKTPEIGRAAVQAILKAAIAHKRGMCPIRPGYAGIMQSC